MPGRRPPRIEGFDYLGPHAYFLTICAFKRIPWFRDPVCAAETIATLLRTSTSYGFEVIAYCLMPDHVHALVDGTRPDSNFLKFVAMFKQRTAFEHARDRGEALWQEGFFEHVVRAEEDFESIAAYILDNPIRAGLCRSANEFRYSGWSRYTFEQLAEVIQMGPNWKSRRP